MALAAETLIAPPLLWSEATSALHELAFRGDITTELRDAGIAALDGLGIERRDHPGLYQEASRIASNLGWAKTYDAEYVALSVLADARLLTRDDRLRRGAGRLTTIVGPAEV